MSVPGARPKWIVRMIEAAVAASILVAGGYVLSASFGPSGLPRGTSLAAFERAIGAEIAAPVSAGGFGVPGVVSASCVMPSSWTAGRSFTCLAFRAHDVEAGSLSGVVRPYRRDGHWNAALEWNGGA